MRLTLYDRLGTVPHFDEDLERDTDGTCGLSYSKRSRQREKNASKSARLSTMSKAYGLPGLRIGWIASQDRGPLERARAVTSRPVSS